MNKYYNLDRIKSLPHHKAMEELTELLVGKTSSSSRLFFQALVAYHICVVPSFMRSVTVSELFGRIPINMYAIGLATSGFGKTHSMNIMENVISGFRDKATNHIFPIVSDASIKKKAELISSMVGSDVEKEYDKLTREFNAAGAPVFVFSSATSAAIKQLHQKLILAGCGALNFTVDEIGSNLAGQSDIFSLFLEIFDVGKTKPRLLKSTNESERGTDLVGSAPANMLLFGTEAKLLDGSSTEELFFDFLETGYARRFLYGYATEEEPASDKSVADIYEELVTQSSSDSEEYWTSRLATLADKSLMNKEIHLDRESNMWLLSYKLQCEHDANQLKTHQIIQKAELRHRYFKVLKLAGAYAFIDGADNLTCEVIDQAVKVVEESGEAFKQLLLRDRNFVRLAKFLAEVDQEVTHAELVTDLAYYPEADNKRREQMQLAIAWGIKNNISITCSRVNGIDFYSGEALEANDGEHILFSYSHDIASGYKTLLHPKESFKRFLGHKGILHWCNHGFEGGLRRKDNVIPKFNVLIFDIDGTDSLSSVSSFMEEYEYYLYTTKSHGIEGDRFRLVLPINYTLSMDDEKYSALVNNVMDSLPFSSDPCSNQRNKKWLTNCNVTHNEGKLFNILPFMPRTVTNNEYNSKFKAFVNLDGLERWFVLHAEEGSRNNLLYRYGLALKDQGEDFTTAGQKVEELNKKLSDPLPVKEVRATILSSLRPHF